MTDCWKCRTLRQESPKPTWPFLSHPNVILQHHSMSNTFHSVQAPGFDWSVLRSSGTGRSSFIAFGTFFRPWKAWDFRLQDIPTGQNHPEHGGWLIQVPWTLHDKCLTLLALQNRFRQRVYIIDFQVPAVSLLSMKNPWGSSMAKHTSMCTTQSQSK